MDKSNGPYQKLPPGWDCKYDQTTGNCYYINYITKAMQLEDPRMRYKQLQNERSSTESIPLQPLHGSPYHVYPSNNLPALRAFQAGPSSTNYTNPSLQNMSASPLLSSRGQLEMSPLPYPKSTFVGQTPRMANMSRRSTIQETSFSNQIDTDAVVTKIQNMFPTASENHIRLLLKKYYNREAVVISALQVEKHPVTMPGPYVTPPAQRHLFHSNSAFYMTPPSRRLDIGAMVGLGNRSGIASSTSRTASPVPGGRFGSLMSMHSGGGVAGGYRGGDGGSGYGYGYGYAPLPFHGSPRFGEQWRNSPKPHSSPKMKLRYMKNIFPKADEMLLLDILAGADDHVQQASEKLISMGYQRRDFVPHSHRPLTEAPEKNPEDEKIIPLRPKEYTLEEKEALRLHLKERYPQIAERIIVMAMESVNYSEDRAIQILQIVQEEDDARAKKPDVALLATVKHVETETDGAVGVHGGTDATDNIITVVLEATCNSNGSSLSNMEKAKSATKKRIVPSINLTTPTTATTQIILSGSPICIDNKSEPTVTAGEQNAENGTTKSTHTNTRITTTTTTMETKTTKETENNLEKAKAIPSISPTSHSSSSTTTLSLSTPPSSSPLSSSPPPTTFKRITTKDMLSRSFSRHAKAFETGVNGYLHGTSTTISATNNNATTNTSKPKSNSCPASILDTFKLTRPRKKSGSLKHALRDSTEEDGEQHQNQEFKSLLGRIAAMGHNTDLVKGPDENLLLADYVTWNGANPDISTGHKQLAVGPDSSRLSERTYTALGRNSELCKGAKAGLAKGSIYAQLSAANSGKNANIKCN